MVKRINQLDNISRIHRGASYIENVEGGKRVFRLYTSREIRINTILQWLVVPGIMFFAGSFGCFFIGYRWR